MKNTDSCESIVPGRYVLTRKIEIEGRMRTRRIGAIIQFTASAGSISGKRWSARRSRKKRRAVSLTNSRYGG
jgi:hypothetical protein